MQVCTSSVHGVCGAGGAQSGDVVGFIGNCTEMDDKNV